MIKIKEIEISYFRSIYKMKIKDLSHLSVFSGKNDSGKSNILKALNLFFNNQTEKNTEFNFDDDISKQRIVDARNAKVRQFISIKITFERGDNSPKSLPEVFTVKKTWKRDSKTPDVVSSIDKDFDNNLIKTDSRVTAKRSLELFLNRIRYEYVPAIRDRKYMNELFETLYLTIISNQSSNAEMTSLITSINKNIKDTSVEMQNEFQKCTGINTEIGLPSDELKYYRTAEVRTNENGNIIPMIFRGDGLQSRFIPSVLNYMSSKTGRSFFIWGFEEPENCLEHALASELAKNMEDEYNKSCQLFITSHSPAFMSLTTDKTSLYRVYKFDYYSKIACYWRNNSENIEEKKELENEMGIVEIYREYQKKYEKALESILARDKKLNDLEKIINSINKPIVLTEGRTDVLIFEEAAKRLNIDLYKFICCDTMEGSEGGAGGASILRQAIQSIRRDQPITIGIFDHDKEGVTEFNRINRNFRKKKDDSKIKLQRKGNSAAILISQIPNRNKYELINNLPIEFVFDDEYLDKEVEGKKLILKNSTLIVTDLFTGEKYEDRIDTDPSKRLIGKESKNHFAAVVVPALPDEAFNNFIILFKKIETAINTLSDIKSND